jgi:hypothetical protein
MRMDKVWWALRELDEWIEKYKNAKEKDQDKQNKDDQQLLSKYANTIKDNIAGIYAIKVDNKILYIGQSKWVSQRVLSHIAQIHSVIKGILFDEKIEIKYKILAYAILTGHKLEFVTLYECDKYENHLYTMDTETLNEALNKNEMLFIEKYQSPLNTYRPQRHKVPNTLEEALSMATEQ